MVQEIQRTSLGADVGRSLSAGLERGAEMGIQRGMLQNALQGLGNLGPKASAFDLAKQLISATAGIPGAERYVGQLFPLLLTEMQGQQSQSNQQQSDLPMKSGGAFGTSPMAWEDRLQMAQKLTKQGVPLDKGIDIANKLNSGSQESLDYLKSTLGSLGIKESEMPDAIQMAQAHPSKDPQEVFKSVLKNIDSIRQFDDALVPGPVKGALKKAGRAAEAYIGLIPGMLSGETREQAIARISPAARKMIQEGHDPIVRRKLANLGLSKTEVQEVIHPLTKPLQSKIDSLPKNRINPDVLSHFMKNNVDPDTSLLVLRHKLWKDKGYDWREINGAIQEAVDNGLSLSDDQKMELVELGTQPPRDSLLDIFADWGRIGGYLKGEK